MLDKMDEVINPVTQFRPVVSEIYSELRRGGKVPGFTKGGQLYAFKGDLRPFGVDAYLYLDGRHSVGHKLEHFNVGKRTIGEVLADTERVIEADPLLNGVSRVDLATDTAIPVTWYRQHARIKFKQFGSELGEMTLTYLEMGKRKIETLYAGNRPNCLRFYNKIAEMQNQYRAAVRGMTKSDPKLRKAAFLVFGGCISANNRSLFDGVEKQPHPGNLRWLAESGYKPDFDVRIGGNDSATPLPETEPIKIPTFEEWSGLSSSVVLTRVERQCGGGKIPDFFRDEKANVTVSTLWNRLQNGYRGQMFDPYENLVFTDQGASVIPTIPEFETEVNPVDGRPRLHRIGSRDYLIIRGLQALVAEQGLQKAYQILNRRTHNGGRLLLKWARYLPCESNGPGIVRFSSNELFEQFRCSIQKQFGCAA